MAASMSEKNAALKKRERSANWIPTEIDLLVDLVEEELNCASLQQVFFFGCDKKIKVQ
jgi:hypothetical protein